MQVEIRPDTIDACVAFLKQHIENRRVSIIHTRNGERYEHLVSAKMTEFEAHLYTNESVSIRFRLTDRMGQETHVTIGSSTGKGWTIINETAFGACFQYQSDPGKRERVGASNTYLIEREAVSDRPLDRSPQHIQFLDRLAERETNFSRADYQTYLSYLGANTGDDLGLSEEWEAYVKEHCEAFPEIGPADNEEQYYQKALKINQLKIQRMQLFHQWLEIANANPA